MVPFYGYSLSFELAPNSWLITESASTESKIQTIWSNQNSDKLIQQMDGYAMQLKLDDMAYLMLLNRVVDQLLPCETKSGKTLFKYAILSKKGFDVLLGKSECQFTVYGRTNFYVENCVFIVKNNRHYYDLSFSQQNRPTIEEPIDLVYNKNIKVRPLVMNMITPPALNAAHTHKTIHFEYEGFQYDYTVKINQSLVSYYQDLPPINISILYLNYGLSPEAQNTLVNQLKFSVSGMPTSKAVDFILKFTQQSFQYKKDEEVYGQEKFSFPEETLINPYADCEDKAMLFAYLINQTLGLKTVGVFYKNAQHINIAVENWSTKQQSNFSFKDQNYIICEPSGNGFSAGETNMNLSYAKLINW